MNISLKDKTQNKTYELEVEGSTSVDVLKLKLSAKYNLNYNLIQLIFKGVILKSPSQSMQQLGVVEGSQLEVQILVPKQRNFLAESPNEKPVSRREWHRPPLSKCRH